ncbi:MAG: hypothetical protein HRU12_19730 [Phaeodactylibacter sp.]|nr:hypothetical protein [Phaeodactylibacter sp.]
MAVICNVPTGVAYEVTALVEYINDLTNGCKEKDAVIADLESDLEDARAKIEELDNELLENK